MSNDTDPVVVLIPGDLHLTDPDLPNHRVALWAVDQANELIRPDFVQFIGDNVQDATRVQFDLFRDLAARLRVPWFALVGDHDCQGDWSAERFRARVGDPIGSLRLRGFRFVRLNTQEGRPVGLSDSQLEWFRAEVEAARMHGDRLVVFQHNYPYQVWEDYAGPGIDGWREIVQTRRIQAIFAGHTHYWQVANDGRNVHVATRSIGDPEGGRPGYTLAYFRGEDLAITYRCTEDAGPLVLITHPRDALLCTSPRHVLRGTDLVQARVWSFDPVTEVQGRIDTGAWFYLHAETPSQWGAALSCEALSKGAHRLEVRAVDHAGSSGSQSIDFVVDPTGRFTAVPQVRPLVSATNFC